MTNTSLAYRLKQKGTGLYFQEVVYSKHGTSECRVELNKFGRIFTDPNHLLKVWRKVEEAKRYVEIHLEKGVMVGHANLIEKYQEMNDVMDALEVEAVELTACKDPHIVEQTDLMIRKAKARVEFEEFLPRICKQSAVSIKDMLDCYYVWRKTPELQHYSYAAALETRFRNDKTLINIDELGIIPHRPLAQKDTIFLLTKEDFNYIALTKAADFKNYLELDKAAQFFVECQLRHNVN